MGKRILVVDDDPDTLTLMGLTLRRYGFEAIKALSGSQALNVLTHDTPDLMILDIMMPQMDGYEVCRQVKSNPHTSRLPVMLLSARAEPVAQVQGFRAGADDYVVKPVSPAELVTRIRAILERAAAVARQQGARIISVLGAKGGVGATTLAVNLALVLAAHSRTVMVDLGASGTVATHLGLSPQHSLGDLLDCPVERIDLARIESALTEHSSGLRLLAAPADPIDAARADAILSRLLFACDVCLFDLGSRLDQASRAIAQRSDDLILVLDSDRATLSQALRVMQGLNAAGLPQRVVKMVWVNRLGTSQEIAQAAIRTVMGDSLVAEIGPAAEDLYQALDQGQPLVVSRPEHPIASEVRMLAASLMTTT